MNLLKDRQAPVSARENLHPVAKQLSSSQSHLSKVVQGALASSGGAAEASEAAVQSQGVCPQPE